jgi:hypothetical protein
MKAIFYVLFAALVLVSAIYILKPQDEPPEMAETPKQEQPVAAKPDSKTAHEAVKEEKPMPAKPQPAPKAGLATSAKQGDLLEAPEGLPFDTSQMADFPALSPPEDDDLPSFGDLPTQGLGDDDFAKDDFFSNEGLLGEGESWEGMDSGELKGEGWKKLDFGEPR